MDWSHKLADWLRAIRHAPSTRRDVEALRGRLAHSEAAADALRAQRVADRAAFDALRAELANERETNKELFAALRARADAADAEARRANEYAAAVLTEVRYRAATMAAEIAALSAKGAHSADEAAVLAERLLAAEAQRQQEGAGATERMHTVQVALDGVAAHLARIDPPFPVLPGAHGGDSAGWLYAGFEETFRGTRAEITARLAEYVPYVRHAHALDKPALDLGCGRGEWLELMRRHGLPAAGVDSNPAIVSFGQALGFDVHEGDAVAFLDDGPAGAYSLITAFHVVEHLPLPRLVALIAAVTRALAPGGLFIVETPDPENLAVSATSFWLDPTHLRPLPAPLTRFLIEAIGLEFVELKRLHPDTALGERAEREAWPAGLRELLCGPRDYAIVARRAVA